MELVDYVTNTPQNTNRTILKQLVNSEKNKAVYESVEELKREGGVGYTEQGKVSISSEMSYTGEVQNGNWETIVPFVSPTPAKIWVKLDGTEYECDAVEKTLANGMVYTLYQGMEEGTPVFAVTILPTDPNSANFIVPAGASTHTIGIYTIDDVIHLINPKYLPEGFGGGGLETVVLTTAISMSPTGSVVLTAEEGVLLDAVAKKGKPFIVSFPVEADGVSGITFQAVADVLYVESMGMCNAYARCMQTSMVIGTHGNGEWMIEFA